MLDHSGELHAIVLAALERGATAVNDPADPRNWFLLTVEDDDPATELIDCEDKPRKAKR